MRAPITDKHLLEMMWERFPEIMKRGIEQPAQQEPVAWEQELANILCRIHRDGGHYVAEHGWSKAINDADLKVAQLNAAFDTTPPNVATPPAAQRQWQGLTDEEKQEWIDAMPYTIEPRHCMILVNVMEAKLKAKNSP